MISEKNFFVEGKISALLGGVILFAGHLINYIQNNGAPTVSGQTLVFFAHAILIFTFIAALQIFKNNPLNRLGIDLSIIGSIFVCSIVFVEIASAYNPEFSAVFNSPVIVYLHNFGPLFFVIGLLIFSISLIKSLYKLEGVLLLSGNILFLVSAFFTLELQSVLALLGSFFTGSGFVYLGYRIKPAAGDIIQDN